MEILNDASAIMAIILKEPNRDRVISLTKGATLVCPEMISFEIGNALTSLLRRKKITKEALKQAYQDYLKIPITKVNVDIPKALEIAGDNLIYAYDAYYLEVASRLNLPLVTFDNQMTRIGKEIKIMILQ
jgi:predicted nucleic acid-binding protein